MGRELVSASDEDSDRMACGPGETAAAVDRNEAY